MKDGWRIVFCLANSGIGGTELNAVRTAERLVDRGYRLEVASLGRHPDLSRRYERAGIPVHVFPMCSLASAAAFRQGLRLWSFLRKRKPHVFHAHDVYGNLFGVPWARLAGVPVVVASRRWWKKEIRRGHGVANRVVSHWADAVVANSPRIADLVDEEQEGKVRVAVVPNYLDEAAFQEPDREVLGRLLADMEVPSDRILIGCVANLRPVKDHATLIRATARLVDAGHEVHLVLVGAGELGDELVSLAREEGLGERVSFAGFRAPTTNLHHLFDISTLTSTDEAFSNSLLEAMAAGNPVVATRVGGTPDAVVDGETGLLVPPGDPKALVGAFELLLSKPDLRRRMGRKGQERAREHFSVDRALTALTDLYTDLVGNTFTRSGRQREETIRETSVEGT